MGDHEDDMDSLDLSERFRASGEARGMVADDIDFEDDEDTEDVDEDEDDDLDDDDDDEDEDDLDDAAADEIDLTVAVYREDGAVVAQALPKEVANDLDDLIAQLRRMPGDSGAIGMVSLVEEIFVLVRVRGATVQVLLSDAAAALDWPIARDVADFLGVDELPDPDEDEAAPLGDLGMLADQGLSQFELSRICDDLDEPSDQLVLDIADRIRVGPQVRRVVESSFS
ncbi:tRNA adenosine deaminase-associated protein [Auraticoccus monumenti]|uniref:Putative tRNA adenosine deaminase-associated protein n=1 Tax=Auraticoccus monumenti TaxID=675864 RepID=A0A1G6SBR5_9ACTN|nr:putative tRNA adenosine deaminase-associated protein [Auraticoccus monumenti]